MTRYMKREEGSKAPEQLLDAASALMRERDVLDVPLLEIAQRAGINAALVKYYFGNKEGLMLALLERDMEDAVSQLSAILDMNVSPVIKLKIHLNGINRTFARIPYLNRLIHVIARESAPDRVAQMSEELLLPVAKAQAAILQEGMEKGLFRKIDPKLFYFASVGMCDALYSSRFTLQSLFGVKQVDESLMRLNVDFLIDLVLDGIRESPADAPA